jgi:5-hydroxyisourate hydrolase
MGISTHILDTSRGRPAEGVIVTLTKRGADGAHVLVHAGVTDADGRAKGLVDGAPAAGEYALHFAVGAYFAQRNQPCFYPEVEVRFVVTAESEHYHVPLLLNPFGYSTYRGS